MKRSIWIQEHQVSSLKSGTVVSVKYPRPYGGKFKVGEILDVRNELDVRIVSVKMSSDREFEFIDICVYEKSNGE